MGGMCEDLGLAWADQFTILGIDIDNKLQRLNDNFNRIDKKVRGIISRWTGYNLSFHGKLTVCKTLLLSQYTYAGSILDSIKTKHLPCNKFKPILTILSIMVKTHPNQELRQKGTISGFIPIPSATTKLMEASDASTLRTSSQV